MEDLVDRYLNANGLSPFILHYDTVQEWKKECIEKINSSPLKKLREKQYEECLDDKEMFQFIAVRAQTRYRQQNYMKSAYKVEVPTESVSCDINYLKYRYRELEKIGFQCTLSEYRKKDQRKLMTKALKEQIAVRDNYTCQMCIRDRIWTKGSATCAALRKEKKKSSGSSRNRASSPKTLEQK